jgi:acyl-homoserine lactone acylase PvdQ
VLRRLVALVVAGMAFGAAPALGAAPVQPYGFDDPGHFWHIDPPGEGGTDNALQLVQFEAAGTHPPHFDDQRNMYTDLLYATPGLQESDIGRYFPDATFGVKPGDVERTYSPGSRDDVTVVRDKQFGIPHIYGTTRAGTMFAEGYVAAEDRLFMMDVLRHYGAADLSSFAGGANVSTDEEQWQAAPYTQADLQKQIDNLPRLLGADGQGVVDDATSYIAGINEYISEAKLDPTKMPAEYAAVGRPQGPDPWKITDLITTASLIGAQLGNGGGDELDQVQLLEADLRRFGAKKGLALWEGLRSGDDPEAPVTATRKKGFPYDQIPKTSPLRYTAMPDPGSLRAAPAATGKSGTATTARRGPGVVTGLMRFPQTDSNALLVSAKKSATGHPLVVFGSQAAYFEPEIYLEEDVHGPGIEARGAAFPGVSLYVELGRGRDYAWSATSAGQDMIDVYAVDLCQDDTHYLWQGQCIPMERLTKPVSWLPNAADSTAAGSETLEADRTKLGPVVARATINRQRVAYVKVRSTYFHEIDSAPAFRDFDDPAKITDVTAFQHAAFKLGYTFNWFYTDDRDIGYINTGANPVRPKGVLGLLPVRYSPRTMWKGFAPADYTEAHQPFAERPQAVDQPVLTSWNNKQARHCCGGTEYTPLYRSLLLDDQINDRLKKNGKMTLPGLIDSAEQAATTDLRGSRLLPWALKALGTPKDPAPAAAAAKLRAWVAHGAHRIDKDRDGHYDDAGAVELMDAWMTTLPKAVFGPVMGDALFKLYDQHHSADVPNSFHSQEHAHLGSSWEEGWFGFLQKDLRTVLDRHRVHGRYPMTFCGRGSKARCRAALESSLRDALAVDPAKLYADPTVAGQCGTMDQQACYDALRFRPLGAVTQPLVPWQNRPTQQQVVEVLGHRPR